MVKIKEQFERINEEEKKNRAIDKPIKISAILKKIDDEDLVVPEFQRDFEWNLDRFVLLFDSIYRGYTIGNLLLWRTTKKLAHKTIGSEKTKTIDQIENKEYTYVLDGQQRLTTLYGILRGKEISRNGNKVKLYKIYFDIKNNVFIKETQKIENLNNRTIKRVILDNDFDKFRFIDMSHIFEDSLNFPDNLIKEEEEINKIALKEGKITQEGYFKEDEEIKSKEKLLKQFSAVIKYFEIPQIVDYNNDIDKVVTVFERINTQNMQLDIYDIMVAKTYENILFNEKKYTFNLNRAVSKLLYTGDLTNEQLSPDKELPDDDNLYYEIEDVTLLRLISIFLNKDDKIALQKKNIYDLKAQKIQENIIGFRKSLSYLHNYCKNQLNINDVNERYTNNNTLSFLTYIFSKTSYRNSNPELLNLWFWNSMVFNRFPGSQLQLIEKDVLAFNKGDEKFKQTINQRRNFLILNDEYTLNDIKLINAGYHKVNSKLYQSCILLLNSLKPKDFDDKHEIELADYIGSNTKNNKHHIIPYNSNVGKELRKKYGGSKGEFIINNIANIAIISSDINKEISKKKPKDYFKEYESTPNFKNILKTHLIDEQMYQYLKDEKYEEFLIARTKKILDLIKEKCIIDNELIQFETHDSDEEEENGN